MRGLGMIASIAALPLVLATAEIGGQEAQVPSTGGAPDAATVEATVVATGIPGAGAITQIGTFHTGGPFHDRAAFAERNHNRATRSPSARAHSAEPPGLLARAPSSP